MRKLASIQRIEQVIPIEGADNIESVRVLGWVCVVKKGEFEPGNLCIYIEIDSVLPNIPQFEFFKKYAKDRRVKTIKLRKIISQGLCLPVGEYLPSEYNGIQVGDDVTSIFGIEKYEPPAEIRGAGYDKMMAFPIVIPKPDETRIQTIPHILEQFKGTPCYITEKIDGTSVTFFKYEGEIGVCSKNVRYQLDASNVYTAMFKKHDLEEKLKSSYDNIAIQGEIVGQKIQSNKYKFPDQKLFIYSIYDIKSQRYYSWDLMNRVCTELGLKCVPYLLGIDLSGGVDDFVGYSKGKSVLNPEVHREGIVIRARGAIDLDLKTMSELGYNRFSFKVINPDFLIKYGE
ncbi:RNA ligase (ATP) [bacterium]|nr:RNA ligase (ATP) [bacterium]